MFKFINKYIIAAVCFYIVWLGLFPFLLTKSALILSKNFSANSNYEIILENPKFKLYILPLAKFGAESITIKQKQTNNKLTVKNFSVKIRLLPLISGKIHINKIQSSDLLVSTQSNKKINLNKDLLNNLKNSSVTADIVKLDKFNIDLKPVNNLPYINYAGKNLYFCKKNRFIKLQTDSYLKINDKNSDIKLNLYLPKNNDIKNTVFEININNLDISEFETIFKNFYNSEINSVSGLINIEADKDELSAKLKNCAIIMKDKEQSIIFPADTNIKSKFNISSDVINIQEFIFNAGKVHFSISGKIRDYISKSLPVLDLNIIINKSRIEDCIHILPSFKVEEIDVFKLKKYMFYGNIIGNLSIKGRINEPDLSGDMFIDDGILIKPIPNAASGARVKLSFKGKHAYYDIFVPAGGGQKVQVKGFQEIYNIKYAELTVKSSENVNLHSAQEVVTPLSEILNFIIGPVPIMDIYGTGNIDITVKGNRKNPHVWGILNFKNANAKFVQMPDLILKNADAVLTFNDKNVFFENPKGEVNGKPFRIKGVCDLSGKFDFSAISQNQPTKELYNAVRTSTFIQNLNKYLPEEEKIYGVTDLNLKIYGNVKDIKDFEFNKNVFAGGNIDIKGNNIGIHGVDFQKVNAGIKLDGLNSDTVITAFADGHPLNISAKIKNNYANIDLDIPKLNPNFILKTLFNEQLGYLPFVSVKGKYKGKIDNIEYDKIDINSNILYYEGKSDIKFNSGSILINNNKLYANDISFYIIDSSNIIKTTLRIDNIFSKKPVYNGNFSISIPDLKILNKVYGRNLLPNHVKNYIKDIEIKSGKLDIKGRISNNRFYTSSDIGGISFNYIPCELPVEITNGKIGINNDNFRFSNINITANNMPMYINGEVKDIYNKQNFNVYINSKPKQEFVDKYVNKNRIYPLKLKGDIAFRAFAKGTPQNYDFKTVVDMYKDSAIYYYGATIGANENNLRLSLESNLKNKTNLRIKEFLAEKIINLPNDKNKTLNMLKVTGLIDILPDDLIFNDLRIKTFNPTDAKVFNIIFGKPNIKHGKFTSDLKLSGRFSNPKIIGNFQISETDIPFLDTTMKNIEFLFKDKTIELASKGEVLGNEVSVKALLENKIVPPYHILNAEVYTKDMDLNRVIKKVKYAGAENINATDSFENFDLNSIIAEKVNLKADNVTLRNINATNFEAQTGLSKDKIFDISSFGFNIAQGHLSGKYKYNLKTNDIKLILDAQSVNANDIAWALFDLKNQIYGDMTGTINLSCTGWSYENCLATLNGNTIFNVKNGKMPKLGSLEYLLRAGNLIKGGITNLSINGVIDLISPLKTGEFSDIFGSITIRDGIAENIEITTQGKAMNLFIGGTYNFSTSNAEMEVLGMISRKLSTMFGPVGNLSVNTLFNLIPGVDLTKESAIRDKINKIPGIEISGKAYRKFVAEIKGNINSENYVKSFRWIN